LKEVLVLKRKRLSIVQIVVVLVRVEPGISVADVILQKLSGTPQTSSATLSSER
jgi:hypothetical protein